MRLVSQKQRRVLLEGSVVDYSVFKRADGKPHPEEGGPEVVYQPTVHVAPLHRRASRGGLEIRGPAPLEMESMQVKMAPAP